MRSIAVTMAVLIAAPLCAQDSAAVTRPDTAGTTPIQRLTKGAVDLGRRSLTVVRRGAEFVFDVDSAVEQWSQRPDQTSATLRTLAPVTFWLPVAAVAATPAIWVDEAEDRHATNAHYARAATVGLAAGFALSRA